MQDSGLITLIALVLGGSVFLLTLISTDAAIVFLIFSMLLSPEIGLAALPDRRVVVRFDDLLLGVVFFTWLAKLAINKELAALKNSPLNLPILAYTLSAIVSTGLGIITGTVESPLKAFFYVLKYVEFYMLYFMASNVIREPAQIQRFINAMFLTSAFVVGYGLYQIVSFGGGDRVTAPFEGPKGEPNTLAGYLLIILGLIAGQLLHGPSVRRKLLLGALGACSVVVFLHTLSRSGYAALLAGYVALLVMARRGRVVLAFLFVLAALVGVAMLPGAVIERIRFTFLPSGPYELFGQRFGLEESALARLVTWRVVLNEWREHMVFGTGVSSLRIVDVQYALVLGEMGIVGALAFLWLVSAIWRSGRGVLRQVRNDGYYYGLTLGFLVSFVALLVQSLGGGVFIIVRIMEPFWFLAAVVMRLPAVERAAQ